MIPVQEEFEGTVWCFSDDFAHGKPYQAPDWFASSIDSTPKTCVLPHRPQLRREFVHDTGMGRNKGRRHPPNSHSFFDRL